MQNWLAARNNPREGARYSADNYQLRGSSAMPEAVVVATARSPIGRAFKGSLISIRPG